MEKSCRTCKRNISLSGCKLCSVAVKYCLGTYIVHHSHEYNLWEPINTEIEGNNIEVKETCDSYVKDTSNTTSETCMNEDYYVNTYKQIADEIADLVTEKQKAYGNSFGEAESFLKLLYPDGIPVEKYKDMLTLVRIWDKIKRIATNKDALGDNSWS